MMNCHVLKREDEVWQVEIAPPFQIVYGGAEDGKQVWTPFEFNIAGFLDDPDIELVQECGAMTYSFQDNTLPFIGIAGSYRGKQFALRIYLEPDPSTKPIEIVDTIQDILRPFTGESS